MKKALKLTLLLTMCLMIALSVFAVMDEGGQNNAYAEEVDYSVLAGIAPVGDGSAANAYQIATVANFKWMHEQLLSVSGDGFVGKYFKLTADVDFSEVANFTSIGYDSATTTYKAFKGNFSGEGFVVKNVLLNATYSSESMGAGFFYYLDAATVSNVTFSNARINGYINNLNYYTNDVGILASTIKSSTVDGITLDGGGVNGGVRVGGLSGSVIDSNISHVRSTASVFSRNEKNQSITGGLVGFWSLSGAVDASLSFSYSLGKIEMFGSDVGRYGGLIGEVKHGDEVKKYLTIDNCYFAGTIVKNGSNDALGAILGKNINDPDTPVNVLLTSCLFNGGFVVSNVEGDTALLYSKAFPGASASSATASQVKSMTDDALKSTASLLAYGWNMSDHWVVDSTKADEVNAVFGKYPDFKSLYDTVTLRVDDVGNNATEILKTETDFYKQVAIIKGNTVTINFTAEIGKEVASVLRTSTSFDADVALDLVKVAGKNVFSYTFVITENSRFVVDFDFANYYVTTSVLANVGDTVQANVGGVLVFDKSLDLQKVPYGAVVRLKVAPDELYNFISIQMWNDDTKTLATLSKVDAGAGEDTLEYYFTIKSNVSISAVFEKKEVSVISALSAEKAGTIQFFKGAKADAVDSDYVASNNKTFFCFAGDLVTIRVRENVTYRFDGFLAKVGNSSAYFEMMNAIYTVPTEDDPWHYIQFRLEPSYKSITVRATLTEVIDVGIAVGSDSIARVVVENLSSKPLPASVSEGSIATYTVTKGQSWVYKVYYLDANGEYVFEGDIDFTSAAAGSFVPYNATIHPGYQRYSLNSFAYKLKVTDKKYNTINNINIKEGNSKIYFNFVEITYSLQLKTDGGTGSVVFKYSLELTNNVEDVAWLDLLQEKNLIEQKYNTTIRVYVQPKGARFDKWTIGNAGEAFNMGNYETFLTDDGATVLVFKYTILDTNREIWANVVKLWTVAITNPDNVTTVNPDAITTGAGWISMINGNPVGQYPTAYEVENGSVVQVSVQIEQHYSLNLSLIDCDVRTQYTRDGKTYYTFTFNSITQYTGVKIELSATQYTPNIFMDDSQYGNILTYGAGTKMTFGTRFKLKAESNYGYRFLYWLINEGKGAKDESNPNKQYEFKFENVEYTHTVVGNDSIEAVYEPFIVSTPFYVITVAAGTGIASVSRGDEFYYENSTATIEATLKSGYVFEGWYSNGALVSRDMRFALRVVDNVTLEARAVPITFTVTTRPLVGGCEIIRSSLKTNYNVGETIDFTVSLSDGYEFVEWLVNGIRPSNATASTLRVVMTEDVVVNAVINSKSTTSSSNTVTKYKIKFICESNQGSIAYAKNEVLPGESLEITAMANNNYVFKYWTINGSNISSEKSYILRYIEENYEVEAVFEPASRAVVYTAGEGGSVEGSAVVLNGQYSAVTIVADYGYRIGSIAIDGDVIDGVNSKNYVYDLLVDRDKVVTVEFVKVFLSAVELSIIVGAFVLVFAFALVLVILMRRKPKASFETMISGLRGGKTVTVTRTVLVDENGNVVEELTAPTEDASYVDYENAGATDNGEIDDEVLKALDPTLAGAEADGEAEGAIATENDGEEATAAKPKKSTKAAAKKTTKSGGKATPKAKKEAKPKAKPQSVTQPEDVIAEDTANENVVDDSVDIDNSDDVE